LRSKRTGRHHERKFPLQNISSTLAQAYAFDTSELICKTGDSCRSLDNSTPTARAESPAGLMDVNDGPRFGALTVQPGTITLDQTNFSDFGRGTLTLTTTVSSQVLNLTYVFYVVDVTILFDRKHAIASSVGSANVAE